MKPPKQVETQRTLLRPLSPIDAEDFYALNLDPKVLKYTGDQPFPNLHAAREFLKNYDQFEKYGVGRMAVIEKATSKWIGWCGLKYSPEKDEYDIGFRFFKAYWNQGFATETAKRCLEYGFTDLGIPKIVGRVMKENIGSIRVLEKIGMKLKETFDFDGHEGLIFEITRAQWKSNPNL